MSDTIATTLTGPGRGAVASVAIAGSDAISFVLTRFQPVAKSVSDLVVNKIYFGTWTWESYSEELVICRIAEQRVEIHCHGGRLASQSILDSLAVLGTQVISSTEWLERVGPDRFAREAIDLLRLATTEKATAILLDQSREAMRGALNAIQIALAGKDQEAAISLVEPIVAAGSLGTRLCRPFSVVLVGAPNTGKSSLVNAVMGYDRAIVYDLPGTTRDVVSASTALDGWPITLTDTAGIRQTVDPIESAGIAIAEQTIAAADLILMVRDLSDPKRFSWPFSFDLATSITVGTKSDLAKSKSDDVDVVTSAVEGTGIDALRRQIIKQLVPNVPTTGSAVPITAWQLERMESLLSLLRQNLLDDARLMLSDLLN